MTTSRLFPSTNGPSSPVSYAGNILAGVLIKVTQGGMWFQGYWHWVPTGGDVVARKFALWNITGAATGTLIPAATVTSGTLTAGQWNFVPLATPVPLAVGTAYNACTGWSAVHGFPDSDVTGAGTGAADSFGTGGHTSGITQGPLFAFSDQGKSAPEPYGNSQGVFGVAGTDPTVNMPATGSNSGNFWMDVQVSDTAPAGYSGSYRLYPSKSDANSATVQDASVNYVLATEFALSQSCRLNKIWYYSPPGTAQLATSADIWSVTGANSGSVVAGTDSPSWSGAAGSGWISCSFTGVTLPAGSYKVSVFNNAATPDGWGAKDASTNYWGTGAGGSGITNGPLSAPGLSTASLAYEFNGNAGGSPAFSNGITERGQSTFAQSGTNIYPYLYVDALGQNYWLDVEVTPVTSTPVSGSETGSGADAGTVAASVPGADTGTGAEGTPSAGFTGPDSGSGADAGTPAAALAGAETGAGTEAGTIGLAASDAGSGADAGTIGVAAAGSDTGSGADTGTLGASVPGADTGTGADDGSVVIPGSVPELRAGLLGGTASNANTYAGSAS